MGTYRKVTFPSLKYESRESLLTHGVYKQKTRRETINSFTKIINFTGEMSLVQARKP